MHDQRDPIEEVFADSFLVRSLASAYFQEAEHLLRGAAALWKGRLGHGRARAETIVQAARNMNAAFDAGRHAFLLAHGYRLFERYTGTTVGCYLLHEYRTKSTVSSYQFTADDLNPEASRRLTHVAVHLVELGLETLRRAGPGAAGEFVLREAEGKVYRELETIGDSALYDDPSSPIPEESLRLISDRAVYRRLYNVANSAYSMFHWRERRPEELSSEYDFWKEVMRRFCRLGDGRYAAFVEAQRVSDEERAALLRVERELSLDSSFYEFNRYFADIIRSNACCARWLVGLLTECLGVGGDTWQRVLAGEPEPEDEPQDVAELRIAFD